MSDDAQQPAAGGEAADRTHPWAAGTGEDTPGQGPAQRADPGVGPGSTTASGEALTWPAPPAPSVHDQQTVTSLPAMGDGSVPPQSPSSPPPAAGGPWATPAAPPQVPGTGAFAPPPYAGGAGSADPFVASGEAVPPPPIAPGGPGQMPYGYPGGYGYPGAAGPGAGPAGYGTVAQQGYYGWGAAPLPSNGPGTAGLVLGIVSAAVFCLWPVAIVAGVLAVVFGAVGRAKASRGEATNGGQALAGIICGGAGVLLGIGFGLIVMLT